MTEGMSQQTESKPTTDHDGFDCGGNGPRWPVPGEESRTQMIGDETNTASANTMADNLEATARLQRIKNWQRDLKYLLDDQDGLALLFGFLERDTGIDSVHYHRLKFYFACDGLRLSDESDEIRIGQLINAISR